MTYNRMFERLVESESNTIQGYVAYCLYKTGKREWIRQFEADNGREPTKQECSDYVKALTPQLTSALQNQAAGALAAFADSAIQDARPNIIENALRGTTTRSIALSIGANFLYTVLLIAIVIVLKIVGIDIIGIFKAI